MRVSAGASSPENSFRKREEMLSGPDALDDLIRLRVSHLRQTPRHLGWRGLPKELKWSSLMGPFILTPMQYKIHVKRVRTSKEPAKSSEMAISGIVFSTSGVSIGGILSSGNEGALQ